MPITTLTREVSATPQTSPEEAVRQAVAGVRAEIDEAEHIEVKQVEVLLRDTNASGYHVTLEITHGNGAEPTGGRETGPHGASSRHSSDAERSLMGLLPLSPEPVPLRIDEHGVARRFGRPVLTRDDPRGRVRPLATAPLANRA